MKVSKAVCTVGSGLGSIMMIGGGLGAAAGIVIGIVMGLDGLSATRVGHFIGTWIIFPLCCAAVAVILVGGWWQLSQWLYGHCQKYWSKG